MKKFLSVLFVSTLVFGVFSCATVDPAVKAYKLLKNTTAAEFTAKLKAYNALSEENKKDAGVAPVAPTATASDADKTDAEKAEKAKTDAEKAALTTFNALANTNAVEFTAKVAAYGKLSTENKKSAHDALIDGDKALLVTYNALVGAAKNLVAYDLLTPAAKVFAGTAPAA